MLSIHTSHGDVEGSPDGDEKSFRCILTSHVAIPIGDTYGIRYATGWLRILGDCVSPDAMLGFEA